jgi:hypothetical protein
MTLVDFAQIISAVATAGAVWASLWIATRHEKPRIIAFPYFDKLQPSSDQQRRVNLVLYVVNVGQLPVRINRVGFTTNLGVTTGWMSDQRIEIDEVRIEPPALLGRGQEARVDMPVFFGIAPWSTAPRGNSRFAPLRFLHRWWTWRHVGFDVYTSLGKNFVRLPVSEVRWLQEHVLQPYDMR